MDLEDAAQKPTGGVNRSRRALGDITNSAPEEGLSGSKKAATGEGITREAPIDAVDRPYMRRPADDIDERDAENPLLCTEVVNQMYDHFGEAEQGN